jgi:hypothetical protein
LEFSFTVDEDFEGLVFFEIFVGESDVEEAALVVEKLGSQA